MRNRVALQHVETLGPARLDLSRARGFSKFVGRGNDMAALEAGLERGTAGRGAVVGVVAEAGTGKSRLCFEFVQSCRARGIPVYEAHGLAHGKQMPLLPVLELYRSFFGIDERDTDRAAREKIAGRLLLLDESLRDELPVVFDMLGVADPAHPLPVMDPEAHQRRVFRAIGHTFVCAGTDGILLETLHTGEIVWEYRNPYSGNVRLADGSPPSPGVEGRPYAIFRASRILEEHPALAGKTLVPLDPQPEWAHQALPSAE